MSKVKNNFSFLFIMRQRKSSKKRDILHIIM